MQPVVITAENPFQSLLESEKIGTVLPSLPQEFQDIYGGDWQYQIPANRP
jgi:hypothetical protein